MSRWSILTKVNLLFFLLFSANYLSANLPEDYLYEGENTRDESYYSQILEKLAIEPINLNKSDKKRFTELFWLTDSEINNLLSLRKEKVIKKLNELHKIGFSDGTIASLKPYLTLDNFAEKGFSEQIRAVAKEKDFAEESFISFYQKYKGYYRNFKFCFLQQKDSQEHSLFNFYSYFLEYDNPNILSKVVVGKYSLAFGQGLIFASKLGQSKSSAVTSIPVKNYYSVKGYSSSYEIWELKGISAIIKYKKLYFTPFYSNSGLQSNLNDDKISSFNESGLNYDDSKPNVKERIFGLNLGFRTKMYNFGLNFADFNFDKKFADENVPNVYSAFSLYFHLKLKKLQLAGESARTAGRNAFVYTLKWGNENFKHLLLWRFYSQNFISWQANAFSEGNMENEHGIYYSFSLKLPSRTKLKCYFDIWNFPNTRYFEKMPTAGNEEFILIEKHTKRQKIAFFIRHKEKEKYKTFDDEAKIRHYQKNTFRIERWNYYKNIELKNRLEVGNEYWSDEKVFEKGILFYQQIKYSADSFTFITRFTAYSSDILLYVYENSITGVMENSVLSGDGFKAFFLCKWKIKRYLELQFKISDELNKKKELKLASQLIMRL